MLGTYRFNAGKFTINAFNITGNIGHPAANRLSLNLVAYASSNAATLQSLPVGLSADLDLLGVTD